MDKGRKGIEKDLLAAMKQAVAFAKSARKGYVVRTFTRASRQVPRPPCCA
jgi:hypothetical protein